MRLNDALGRFVLHLRADGRSEHTIGNYRRHVGSLARWLAQARRDDDLDAITPEILAAFLVSPDARASAHGGAKSTISMNALRTSLRVAFAWMHEAGLCARNPARLVRRAITAPPPPRSLSDAEVDRLDTELICAQGELARRDHLLIDLLLSTGVRIGSALALDVEDVDLAARTLRLRELKGDRVDRVYFGRDLADHLIGFLAGKPRTGPLFRGPRGERLVKRHAQRRITQWLDRIGANDASPHSLRHTFATRLLRRTGDLFLVKRALLHRSIASTAVYLSVSDDQLRAALEA